MNIGSESVQTLRSWVSGVGGEAVYITKVVRLKLTGQGGLTNKIPASAFGFAKIVNCSNAYNWNDPFLGIVPAAVNSDLDMLLLGGVKPPPPHENILTIPPTDFFSQEEKEFEYQVTVTGIV